MSAVVVFVVAEGIAAFPAFGLDTDTKQSAGSGTQLSVHYATATRAQLATPLEVTIQGAATTDNVVLSVSSDYLDVFKSSGVSPQPTSETSNDNDLVMTFDPPPAGQALVVGWELEPKPVGWFTSKSADVSVLDSDANPVVTVHINTAVRP
ncbi:MAG TPA: hypothetical protein VGC84_06105 [Ilumatobacteraceae bacterium]